MTNRRILYGYQIQNGVYRVRQTEAEVVRQVFSMYLNGTSYQAISDHLNREGIPYSDAIPEWNKHKVKRLLENERYTGKDGYPAIISSADFQAVQTIRLSKKPDAPPRKKADPSDWLWNHVYCEKCGERLIRIGGPYRQTRIVYLECKTCNYRIRVTRDELFGTVIQQASRFENAAKFQYVPTEAAFRVESKINRCLKQPTETQAATEAILEGISARYSACVAIQESDADANLTAEQLDWLVAQVTISQQNEVHVTFK